MRAIATALLVAISLGGSTKPRPCPAPSQLEAAAHRVANAWMEFRRCAEAPVPNNDPAQACDRGPRLDALIRELDALAALEGTQK